MKKLFLVLFVCVVTAFALCGCGDNGYKMVSGQVTAVEYDGVGYPKYTVLTPDSYEVGITLDETTVLFSWIEGVDAEKLRTGDISDWDEITIVADCNYDKIKPLSKGGGYETVPQITIDAVLYKNVKTFADGTAVDMWQQHNSVVYQLSDGIELLWINEPTGPENVYSGISESFDAFAEQAKPVVLQYYDSRGLLYDADQCLEQAYTRYKNDRENFNTHYIHQDILPSAGNENIMCFMTSLTLPHTDGYMSQEIRMGEIFDRKTGQHISGFDIFNCDVQQAMDVIVDSVFEDVEFNTSNIDDVEKFKKEIKAAVKPEYIILWSENMEISFPSGVLPNEENCYIIGIDYTDEIKAIMHPWALPEQNRG